VPEGSQETNQDRLLHLQQFSSDTYAAGPSATRLGSSLASLARSNAGALALIGPSGISLKLPIPRTAFALRSKHCGLSVRAGGRSREEQAKRSHWHIGKRTSPPIAVCCYCRSVKQPSNRATKTNPFLRDPYWSSALISTSHRYCDVFVRDVL